MSKKIGNNARLMMQYYSDKQSQIGNDESMPLSMSELIEDIKIKINETSLFYINGFVPEITANGTGLKGRAKVFLQRAIRKLSRFIYLQFADKLYEFQYRTIEVLDGLCRVAVLQEESIRDLKKELEEKNDTIRALSEKSEKVIQ